MAEFIRQTGKVGISLLLVLLVFGAFIYSARPLTFAQTDATSSEPGTTELEAADAYLKDQYYSEAELIYRDIVTLYPETGAALKALKSLVFMYIDLSNDALAADALNELAADFYEQPSAAAAVFEISEKYRLLSRDRQAADLSRYIVENWPDSNSALWSQAEIAMLTAFTDDPNDISGEAVEREINRLLTDYSGYADLPEAVIQVAGSCLEQKHYQKACRLYQYVIDNFPVESRSVKIQSDLAVFSSDIGTDPNAFEMDVESLIANNEGDTELPGAVFDIAARYYKRSLAEDDKGDKERSRKHLQKAISSFESILNNPQSAASADPETLTVLAQSYRRSGQFQKAIDTYEKLLETFPDCQYPWHVEFAMGRCYQRLKQNGLIPIDEADSKTRALYENLLWNYPACRAAAGARSWLDELAGSEQGGVK